MVPLLLLTLVFVFSYAINDVSATQETSNNTVVASNSSTVSITEEASQTTDQSTANTNTSNTDNSSDYLNSETDQTLKDPQIYNGGVPVARGSHPAGYIYPTILAAITDALSGDTIMLEDGAIFPEYGLVIDKNLNFDVFNNGYATIDGGNFGTIFIINNGVVVNLQNL
ncbi:MAG: hypothetical protein GYA51_15920, partial [Candidatus Methanofastidiosa archaeon]|nr:hypothetical protein [Candidatus Methanofastidiosa archaeon]